MPRKKKDDIETKQAAREFNRPDPRDPDKFIFTFDTKADYDNYLKVIPEPEPLTDDDLLRILDVTHADIRIRIPCTTTNHAMPVTALYASLIDSRSQAAISDAVKTMRDFRQYVIDKTGISVTTRESMAQRIDNVMHSHEGDLTKSSNFSLTTHDIKKNKDLFSPQEYAAVDVKNNRGNVYLIRNKKDKDGKVITDANGNPEKTITKYDRKLVQKQLINMLAASHYTDNYTDPDDHPVKDHECGYLMYKGHRVVLSNVGPVFAESNVRTVDDYNDLCKRLGREDKMIPDSERGNNAYGYVPIPKYASGELIEEEKAYEIFTETHMADHRILGDKTIYSPDKPTHGEAKMLENCVIYGRNGIDWMRHGINVTKQDLPETNKDELEIRALEKARREALHEKIVEKSNKSQPVSTRKYFGERMKRPGLDRFDMDR